MILCNTCGHALDEGSETCSVRGALSGEPGLLHAPSNSTQAMIAEVETSFGP